MFLFVGRGELVKYVVMGINIRYQERGNCQKMMCFCPVQLLDHLFPPTENIRQEVDL